MDFVDFKHRFVFVHIPKMGGTSISYALKALGAENSITGAENGSARKKGHNGLKGLEREFGERLNGMFKFCVVRNPLEWGVSLYHHFGSLNPTRRLRKVAHDVSNYKEFLRAVKASPGLRRRVKEQLWYASGLDDRPHMDLIIRFDNLQAGFDEAMSTIGMGTMRLPFKNASRPRPSYQSFYDAEATELFKGLFRHDVRGWWLPQD